MTIITIQLLWVPDDIKQQYDDDDDDDDTIAKLCWWQPCHCETCFSIQHATIQLDSRYSPRNQSSRLLRDAWSWGWGLAVVQGRLIMLFTELYSVI